MRNEYSTTAILACMICILCTGAAHGQQVDRTILLPDSFGGLQILSSPVWDSVDNRVYVAAQQSEGVLAIDGVTNRKLARIPTGHATQDLCYCAWRNRLYTVSGSQYGYRDTVVTAIDCAANQVIANVRVPKGTGLIVSARTSDKVYCASNTYDMDTVTVIDCATNQVGAKLDVGSRTAALSYNSVNNRVYCGLAEGGEVVVIDAARDSVVTRLASGAVTGLCWNPVDNKLYVAGSESSVIVIDGASNQIIREIVLPILVGAMVFSPASDRLYCTEGSGNNSIVAVISGAGDSVTATLSVDFYLDVLAYNSVSNRVFCASSQLPKLYVLDCATDSVIAVVSANYAQALCFNPLSNKLYSSGAWMSSDLLIVDAAANQVVTDLLFWFEPHWLCYNSVNDRVYCANDNGYGAVAIVEGATHQVDTVIRVGNSPTGLLYNSQHNKVYCATRGDSGLVVISGDSSRVIAHVQVSSNVSLLGLNTLNGRVYCADYQNQALAVIDGAGDSLVASVPLPCQVTYGCFNSTDNKLYCAGYPLDSVVVIDGTTNQITREIPVGSEPSALAYNRHNNRVYCVNYQSRDITVIDAARDSVVGSITGIPYPYFLLYDSVSNKLYCHCGSDMGLVAVIDCAADTLILFLPSGSYPDGPAFCLDAARDRIYIPCEGQPGAVTVIDGPTNRVIKSLLVGDDPVSVVWNSRDNLVYCANCGSSSLSVIRDASGVEETPKQTVTNLRIWPNPCRSYVNLALTDRTMQPRLVCCYDASGRRVRELLVPPDQSAARFDLRALASGIYFIALRDRPAQRQKVIVEQ
jgi:YVTN family beta-propeller protein